MFGEAIPIAMKRHVTYSLKVYLLTRIDLDLRRSARVELFP
jgi:hypothetical protein|tara:strand:- start:2268 stop:2390 length:123 start_codon:yes stop_codon:yes gene_type:complete